MNRLAVSKQIFLLRVEDEFPELIDKSFVLSRFHWLKKPEKLQDFFRRFQS